MRKPLIYILTILSWLSLLLSSSPTFAAMFSSPNSQIIQPSPQPEADSPADSPTTPQAIIASRVYLPLLSQTWTPPGTPAPSDDFTDRDGFRLPGEETPSRAAAYGGNVPIFNPVTAPGRIAETLVSTLPVKQIVSGGTHTCALTPEGGVVCWGANDLGQLGNGTTNQSDVPVAVLGLSSGVLSLGLAWGRTCALTTLGRVYCWGGDYSSSGGTSSVPVEFNGLGNQVVQLAVGEHHACARTSSGKVLCWGFNTDGQLGNGTFADSLTPVVAIAANAAQITVRDYTSCAVLTNGGVQCWGDGSSGQLGDGVAGEGHKSNVPVQVLAEGGSPLTGATQVELGLVFGCALVGSGVQCWGVNRFGQLGNGEIINVSRPLAGPVLNSLGGPALSGADQITTGESFACAHLTSGRVQCWGNNTMGQQGNGGSVDSGLPVTVRNPAGTAPLEGAASVTTGSWHTCIFTDWEATHPFYCWGSNYMGQLGTGSVPDIYPLPQPVADISGLGGGGGQGLEMQIVAGGTHTCARTTGEGLKCWGSNSRGQLGDGTGTDRLNPVDVAGMGSDVKSMALGQNFTCAVLPWGRLKCWGENTHGQLGNGNKIDSPLPVTAILPDVSVRQVAAGDGHACVLTQAGSVLCWGDNSFGQLGDGSTTASTAPVTAIAAGAVGLALGGSTSCAVLSGGGLQCWGLGDYGQLGDGGRGAGHKQTSPVNVQASGGGLLAGATQVALGANFGCALLEGGLVDCWGKNNAGQLGQGETSGLSAFAKPVVTEIGGNPLEGATQVSAGGAHACVRLYTDRLQCWGQGESGQLGDGSSGSGAISALPHPVVDHYAPYGQSIPYLEATSQVSAGGAHTCAFIKWNGSNPYRCWGDNSRGQLGVGDGTNSAQLAESLTIRIYPNPVQDSVNFGSPPLAKLASGNSFTCALTRAGGVKCWGANSLGQLGDGTNTNSNTPVSVAGLSSGVIGLVAGPNHACALTAAGGVKCWGYNNSGQLGDGTVANSNTPVNVSGLASGVIELAAGGIVGYGSHTCALVSTGGVKCWGANDKGQLGNSTNTDSNTPVNVSGLSSGVIGIATGSRHTCALTSGGGVKCWGFNFAGQLGNGSATDSNAPVNVSGLSSGVVGLELGWLHSCALTSAGGVKCWGDSIGVHHSVPVDISGLSSNVIELSAGGGHTCALTTGGGVKCWGSNGYGELGDGDVVYTNIPVNVVGLSSGVTSLSAGWSNTCAVLSGVAPLRCWGDNQFGQFGNGNTNSSLTPVDSKWLTAEGLVEDNKTEVILPIPHVALVAPAQPVVTPVVVAVTQVLAPPAPCTNCIPVDVALQLDILSDEKPRLPMYFHWDYTSLLPPSANTLRSAVGFNEQSLNLYKYVLGTWIPMLPCTGCSLDIANHALIAPLDGEGLYAIMAGPQTHQIYLPLLMR